MKKGDIVKSKNSDIHYVVGDLSIDGAVIFGYSLNNREEARIEARSVEVVYSTNENIKKNS